jgi:hypothetical protein
MEMITKYFAEKAKVSNGEAIKEEIEVTLDRYEIFFQYRKDLTKDETFSQSVSTQEVFTKARSLKLSSAGWDGITPYIIKILGSSENTNDILTQTINCILETLSEEDLLGLINAIPKKENLNTLDDYRPITVLNALTHFALAIIAERFKNFLHIHKIIHETHQGFVKGVKTITNAVLLQ